MRARSAKPAVPLRRGLGYAFGTQWELVNDYMGNVSGLAVGLLVCGLGIYFLRPKNGRNGETKA